MTVKAAAVSSDVSQTSKSSLFAGPGPGTLGVPRPEIVRGVGSAADRPREEREAEGGQLS